MAGAASRIPRKVVAAKRLLTQSLAAEPGVLGVGIEADEKNQPVLLVLLQEGAPGGGRKVPVTFQGIPVSVRITSRSKKFPR